MRLFVIRHAIAEDAAPGEDDAHRALTRDGRKKVRQAIQGLRAYGVRCERVLSSPWTRARDTADLLGALGGGPPQLTDLLTASPRAELLALIAEAGQDTAVVGHQPWLGELVAWLAFGDTKHGEALALKKAGVVELIGAAVPGGMRLCALLPPRVLRGLR